MPIWIIVFIFIYIYSPLSSAIDLGLSGSEKDIALDVRGTNSNNPNWGGYIRVIVDSGEYQNGKNVSVCNDGSISGSTGSGTCSSHSGVNYTENAEFNRIAGAFGATYSVTDSFQLHGGVIVGMYTSNINIGDKDKYNFNKVGIDVGISDKILNDLDLKLFLSHETERDRTYIGFLIPVFNWGEGRYLAWSLMPVYEEDGQGI